ncbi:ABC transporter ATP-binding protein [Pseudomonas sp. LRF_L74]|uniref:ABC transporter ATP-binding protein n=1 Tax=Pseudomonas sp. LRF_L74 TaxID=3369422 RepID=UPI003F605F65
MLRLVDIRKTRGSGSQRYRLEVPQLELRPGQRIALIGASGSGKSTLLDILALALSPDAGGLLEYQFDGQRHDIGVLWQTARHDALGRIRARACGYVLQTGGLLGFLDVRANIRLPLDLIGQADRGGVQALARQLDIADLLEESPGHLSVGQRQRVSIARALVHRPALILADEPTASLDPLNAQRVMDLLVEQATARDLCLVVATHDAELARRHDLLPLHLSLARDERGDVIARLEALP